MTTVSCPKQSQLVYRPRKPERTALFQVIKKHFNTWYSNSENPIPGYVSMMYIIEIFVSLFLEQKMAFLRSRWMEWLILSLYQIHHIEMIIAIHRTGKIDEF